MIYADSVEKRLQLDNADLRRQLQEAKFDLEDATNSRRDLQQRLITLESRADTTTIVEDNDTVCTPLDQ